MAINVSQMTKTYANALNSKGYRLLSKECGVKIKKAKEFVPKKEIPKNSVSADIVKIENVFRNETQDIFSFRDSNGNIIKRIIRNYKDSNEVFKTVNTYHKERDFISIQRKKSVLDDELQDIKDLVSINSKSSPFTIDRVKLTVNKNQNGIRDEYQVFEEFTKSGKDRKYIETKALRLQDGTVTNKEIKTNIANPDIHNLTSDPYLFTRNYNFEDFVKSIFPHAKKIQNVQNKDITIKTGFIDGIVRGQSVFGRIKVDCSRHNDLPELIDTVNHELRHQYQRDLRKKLGFFDFLFNKTPKNCDLTAEELNLARKFKKAWILYCPPEWNWALYNINFLEVDARAGGLIGRNDFINSSKKLMSYFPKADPRLFHLNNKNYPA